MSAATPTGDNFDRDRQLAQLEQIRLQNEKLQLELAELKKGKFWSRSLGQMIPVITAMIAIGGFGFGVVRYSEEESQRRAQEKKANEHEIMKPWLENQRDTYKEALSAAAAVANSADAVIEKKAAEEFWRLYQGRMILVETTAVSDAMVAFGQCLDFTRVQCSREEMNRLARALGTEMAKSMEATAEMTYAQFSKQKFQYHR